jgi:hypothetical protein
MQSLWLLFKRKTMTTVKTGPLEEVIEYFFTQYLGLPHNPTTRENVELFLKYLWMRGYEVTDTIKDETIE